MQSVPSVGKGLQSLERCHEHPLQHAVPHFNKRFRPDDACFQMQDESFFAMSPHQATITMKKIGSFSLIERVILSAGAMLIFSVSFQIDQMPEGEERKKENKQSREKGARFI